MINISYTDDFSLDYYNFVVFGTKKIKFDVDSQIEGIKKNIEKDILKIKNKDDLEFINFLQSKLENIVIGNINELNQIQKIIEVNHTKVWDKIKSYNPKIHKEKEGFYIYTFLEKKFIEYGYGSVISDKIAYKMIEKLDTKVCPYCNINYISYIGTNKDKAVRPELDHFFPKSVYPYFAISLYNLVPSCRNCNSLKSDNFSKELISPFEISKNNDDFRFKYKILKNIDILSANLEQIEAGIEKITFEKKIEANNTMFSLENLYQVHKDIVAEIIWKNRNYPKILRESFKDFGISQNEAYRIIFCNYAKPNEFSKRPLSKLTYDIHSYFK